MRKRLLRVYSFITNYRYRKIVKLALAKGDQPGPEKEPAETNALLPRYYQGLKTEVIVQKATASLTSVSALLAFTVALVPLIVWKQFDNLFTIPEDSRHMVVFWTAVAFLLPYLTFWIERHISVANVEEDKKVRRKNRYWRSWALVLSLVLSVCLFVGMPWWQATLKDTFSQSFLLAGTAMILLSAVFLLFALEFYDSAAGWRGGVGLHFHLAGIASNSFVFGISLAFTGAALTVFEFNFVIGQILVIGTLLVLVALTEIERALWDLDREAPGTPTSSAAGSSR